MKKIVMAGIVVVVVLAAIGVYYLVTNLNSIVAGAIEKHGSAATETHVGVSGVDISLREGRGSITDLRIASPEGFKAADVFVLGDITVDVDVSSVREEPIVIDEVLIKAPVINFEVLKNGSSNVEQLRKNLQKQGGASQGGGGGGDKEKNIRINKFVFERGKIEIDASALGVEKRTITLPEIRMTNVGGKNGAPPDEIARLIIGAAAKKATSEIAGSEVNQLIEKQLGGSLGDKAKGLLDKITN